VCVGAYAPTHTHFAIHFYHGLRSYFYLLLKQIQRSHPGVVQVLLHGALVERPDRSTAPPAKATAPPAVLSFALPGDFSQDGMPAPASTP
jgi:hypothetical protein